MRQTIAALALAGLCFVAPAYAQQAAPVAPAPLTAEQQRTVERLREAALASDHAYEIVEDLVTRVGPRLAGSPAEARAREWAQARMRAEGFTNVRVDPFEIEFWDATREHAEIVSPSPQTLSVAALGGSPSTPAGGVEGEVVRFANIAALMAASAEAVRGRIVFIDEGMTRTQNSDGYRVGVAKRGRCAPEAQARGAVACVIRSVGTNADRFPHQGGRARQADGASLPAAALSPPDSDVLARLLAQGPVRLRLEIESVMGTGPSGNVLGEIRGRERPNEIVLAAAHLDSWDMGQGAVDDGAGIAIITAAAKLIRDLPRRPRRTIRLFYAGSEENSPNGGVTYLQLHGSETHIIASESDLGADRIWRARTSFGAGRESYAAAIQAALAPLDIVAGGNDATPGADITALVQSGVPAMGLDQDASRYFDVHHTANDGLHMIDREQLRQNVAAWAIFLYLAADTDWDFRAAAP